MSPGTNLSWCITVGASWTEDFAERTSPQQRLKHEATQYIFSVLQVPGIGRANERAEHDSPSTQLWLEHQASHNKTHAVGSTKGPQRAAGFVCTTLMGLPGLLRQIVGGPRELKTTPCLFCYSSLFIFIERVLPLSGW